MEEAGVVTLDGTNLTPELLARIGRDPGVRVAISEEARARVARGRRVVEEVAARYAARHASSGQAPLLQDYGITTGFGEFRDVPVPPEHLVDLQHNILRSHATGVGPALDPADRRSCFPDAVVRAAIAVRLNAFLLGHSGVRLELVDALIEMLHRRVVPVVPLKGSLGASGDLCPLAHLFLPLIGEGQFRLAGEETVYDGRELECVTGMKPVRLSFKEGLALVNGATVTAALLALCVADAEGLVQAADVVAAMTLEALCGCARALDPAVHRARGMPGQIDAATSMRMVLEGSKLVDRAGEVQDPYSIRCAPQVHGAARDALAFARLVVTAELNAATDNPLFFPGPDGALHAAAPWDVRFSANWPEGYDGRQRASYSAGNFHGQPLGAAADGLAIALAELADVAERRIQLVLDARHNRNLPRNLTGHPGVHSGMMLLQYTAAALVADNRVLAHPASVDSVPTSSNMEDHVAMASTAARKLREVLLNVEAALAIEWLVAAQALDWRVFGGPDGGLRQPVLARPPEPTHDAAVAQLAAFREVSRRDEAADAARVWIAPGTAAAWRCLRERVPALVEDRVLAGDIAEARRLLRARALHAAVEGALGHPLVPVRRLAWASAEASPTVLRTSLID